MAIWCILAAPLIMSNDLRNIKPESKEILLNKLAISVNQDSLGVQGRKLYSVNCNLLLVLRDVDRSDIRRNVNLVDGHSVHRAAFLHATAKQQYFVSFLQPNHVADFMK